MDQASPQIWTIVSSAPHKRQKYPIKSDLVRPNFKKPQAEKLCRAAARAAERFSAVPPPPTPAHPLACGLSWNWEGGKG